ncbi:hypothetical protein GE09DRAFT_369612 [Coniochaeta sp. 2T2.1]|nr:hypothetical protein GE09DRAFT_369612 [Coniochaeta sp. 2T2.1]
MSVLPGPSKLDFIPWDFTSEDHVQRAYLQRFACGWRWWELDDWVKANKAGKMMVYWLVLTDEVPDREAQVATHIARYPKESLPLTDTAPQSWLNTPRTPTNRPLNPIGHVALTLQSPQDLIPVGLDPGSTKAASIGKLYVSYALQSHGYGGLAMRAVETIAETQLGCDMCILDTIVEEFQMRRDVMERWYTAGGNPLPKISNQAWYIKMGYEIFHKDEKGYLHTHADDGSQEYLPVAYFRKMLR